MSGLHSPRGVGARAPRDVLARWRTVVRSTSVRRLAARRRRRQTQELGRRILTAASVLAAVVTVLSSSTGSTDPASASRLPSVVVIVADDLDAKLLERHPALFPNFHSYIVQHGVQFTNSFVVDSLCCPSRATILRGQYNHNTGIDGNVLPHGGFQRFQQLGLEQSTIATWLHDAGYATGHFGKYLNDYPGALPPSYVPPGWDKWVVPNAGNAYQNYNYGLNVDGRSTWHGATRGDYLTDVITHHSVRFIAENAGKRPLFAMITPYAPHLPALPPPRYEGTAKRLHAPHGPSYDEADVSDKPKFLQESPRVSADLAGAFDRAYRARVESMRAVDDMIGRVMRKLRQTGQLDNTYLFFTSDNGFHLGDHRLKAGKLTAYEPDIRVPLVVRGPGVPERATRSQMVANLDLAPTIAALTHANTPSFVDGRSYASLLTSRPQASGRSTLLIEHSSADVDQGIAEGLYGQAPSTPTTAPANPDVPEPVADPKVGKDVTIEFIRGYHALRTTTMLYVEWDDEELELYDLRHDPDELRNIAQTASPDTIAGLHARLTALTGCQAASCRSLEDQPVPGPASAP
jgi:N-acetylglucosamine-6-sulfatase